MLLMAVAVRTGWSEVNPGDEVVVVYNSRVPESKSIAEHYAALRHVPADQLFGFDLSTGIEMSRREFASELQRPLADKLERAELWRTGSLLVPATNGQPAHLDWVVKRSKIRYLVLCYGVPVRIAEDPSINEPALQQTRPELRRNTAAVDSELALLPRLDQNLVLGGPLPNPLFSSTNAVAFNPTNSVLMVTRLDGPTPEIARRLVDKAMAAETNGLWGRAYFDLRGITDPAYKPGDVMLAAAATFARIWGYETIMDTNPATFPVEFPLSQVAIYCGWYDGTVSGPFTRPTVEFMPGAFAYHLHSFSAANIRSATENWAGPLLAKGATCTMGSVSEPYLSGTPDMSVFIARLTYFGFTFGEAACAAQGTLSWQTTVVGDPLYRPFAKSPQALNEDMQRDHNQLIEWTYLHLANMNLGRHAPIGAIAALLESLPVTKTSAVLTEKLADLYTELGKPSSAAETYADALQRHPSPQQRVRLQLTLSSKLIGLGRQSEAMDVLNQLLKDSPDYPDKVGIYSQLHALAQKLNRKEEMARYRDMVTKLTALSPSSAESK